MYKFNGFTRANSEQDWKHKWLELKDQPQSFERWHLNISKIELGRKAVLEA
jgi:hypothetical protein